MIRLYLMILKPTDIFTMSSIRQSNGMCLITITNPGYSTEFILNSVDSKWDNDSWDRE